MNTQTLTTEVVFRRPFVLGGLDGIQPPGTYKIETYSELVDSPTVVAYRRVATSIELHNQPVGTIRTATIDPAELEEALRLDAAPEVGRAAAVRQTGSGTSQRTPARSHAALWLSPISAISRNDAVQWYHHVTGGSSERHWKQWISLNANELTWIALVIGGLFLLSFGH